MLDCQLSAQNIHWIAARWRFLMELPGINMDAVMTINSRKIREKVRRYKGYTAQYCFDRRDYLFVGRLSNTSAIVGFHGRSMRALRFAFRVALEACLDDLQAVSDRFPK
jgi:hypothetical protein